MYRETEAARKRPRLVLMTALFLLTASPGPGSGELAPPPSPAKFPGTPGASDLVLSSAEWDLLGTWRGEPEADGSRLLIKLRADRTATSWFEGGAIGPTPSDYVYWELKSSGRLLLAKEGADGTVRLIDAFWAPSEALRLSANRLHRGERQAPLTRLPAEAASTRW